MVTLRSNGPNSGLYLASPNQASKLFSPTAAPVRQKNVFLVRFLRRTTIAAGPDDGFSFAVKSIDRPSVKPVVEELNQYNKKRQVQTGIKYDPINLTVYDTTDMRGGAGAATKMWIQYASYHFGDYNHASNIRDFDDDILNEKMNKAGGGYGLKLPSMGDPDLEGRNTQFFFEGLEVLQVHGGYYTKYTLVNPRISGFTPDDLDYSNSEVATIQMQISYEAVVHHNNGESVKISDDPAVQQHYRGLLYGEAMDYRPEQERSPTVQSVPRGVAAPADPLAAMRGPLAQPPVNTGIVPPNLTNGGVLERFGSYDFGNLPDSRYGFPSEVSLAGGNIGSAVGSNNAANLSQAVVRGIYGAAQQIGVSPLDIAQNTSGGLTINSAALAISNQSSDGTSHIGFRRPSGLA